MEIGGGFGGKIRVYLEPVAAVLSRKTGRPVKMTMNRAEVFEATGPTPGSYIRVKMGADASGRLTAAQAYLAYEAGAFPGSPVGAGRDVRLRVLRHPQRRRSTATTWSSTSRRPRAYRAPARPTPPSPPRRSIDEICEQLKIDPLDFRIKNGAKEGTRRADGPVYPRIGMIETCAGGQAHPHYTRPTQLRRGATSVRGPGRRLAWG